MQVRNKKKHLKEVTDQPGRHKHEKNEQRDLQKWRGLQQCGVGF